jgi:tetratricopeptide (TPR) repeat protein
VAGELADTDPQSLLPIALLHQQLVRRYVARHEFVLAGFARSVAADRAVQIAGQPSDRVFAAALLVNLASDQARTASGTLATSYIEEALAAEPSSRAALLALGAIFERSADYNQAVQVFERLVEIHPDFAEGRLRLAVNLARSGRERAAEKEFRILLDRNGTSWVDSLAAQEYARMMIDQQRGEEAQLLLSASAARLPDDQRLRVLGAFNADTAGQSLEAVEAILHLPPAEAGTSPRVRYTEWPDLGGAASAAVLREAAEAALPDLTEALQAAEGTK